MNWKQVNPAMWQAEYMGYTLYKCFLHKDAVGSEHYLFSASKPGARTVKASTWTGLSRKLKSKQLTIFSNHKNIKSWN